MKSQSFAAAHEDDYFSNHSVVRKWPFTIYHSPIESALIDCVKSYAKDLTAKPEVLVFGCGFFHEADALRDLGSFTLVDQDKRLGAVFRNDSLRSRLPFHVINTAGDMKIFPAEKFDLIISKEVIEHITDMAAYFSVFKRVLKPGGKLWLSTPNYGGFALPFIENTFLELVARSKGFSRAGIHPNKYSKEKLARELSQAGFHQTEIRTTPLALALISESIRK